MADAADTLERCEAIITRLQTTVLDQQAELQALRQQVGQMDPRARTRTPSKAPSRPSRDNSPTKVLENQPQQQLQQRVVVGESEPSQEEEEDFYREEEHLGDTLRSSSGSHSSSATTEDNDDGDSDDDNDGTGAFEDVGPDEYAALSISEALLNIFRTTRNAPKSSSAPVRAKGPDGRGRERAPAGMGSAASATTTRNPPPSASTNRPKPTPLDLSDTYTFRSEFPKLSPLTETKERHQQRQQPSFGAASTVERTASGPATRERLRMETTVPPSSRHTMNDAPASGDDPRVGSNLNTKKKSKVPQLPIHWQEAVDQFIRQRLEHYVAYMDRRLAQSVATRLNRVTKGNIETTVGKELYKVLQEAFYDVHHPSHDKLRRLVGTNAEAITAPTNVEQKQRPHHAQRSSGKEPTSHHDTYRASGIAPGATSTGYPTPRWEGQGVYGVAAAADDLGIRPSTVPRKVSPATMKRMPEYHPLGRASGDTAYPAPRVLSPPVRASGNTPVRRYTAGLSTVVSPMTDISTSRSSSSSSMSSRDVRRILQKTSAKQKGSTLLSGSPVGTTFSTARAAAQHASTALAARNFAAILSAHQSGSHAPPDGVNNSNAVLDASRGSDMRMSLDRTAPPPSGTTTTATVRKIVSPSSAPTVRAADSAAPKGKLNDVLLDRVRGLIRHLDEIEKYPVPSGSSSTADPPAVDPKVIRHVKPIGTEMAAPTTTDSSFSSNYPRVAQPMPHHHNNNNTRDAPDIGTARSEPKASTVSEPRRHPSPPAVVPTKPSGDAPAVRNSSSATSAATSTKVPTPVPVKAKATKTATPTNTKTAGAPPPVDAKWALQRLQQLQQRQQSFGSTSTSSSSGDAPAASDNTTTAGSEGSSAVQPRDGRPPIPAQR